jgi:hypothetical protein
MGAFANPQPFAHSAIGELVGVGYEGAYGYGVEYNEIIAGPGVRVGKCVGHGAVCAVVVG